MPSGLAVTSTTVKNLIETYCWFIFKTRLNNQFIIRLLVLMTPNNKLIVLKKKTQTCLAEVDFHSSRIAQARDTDIHSRLPGCKEEFQTHPETLNTFQCSCLSVGERQKLKKKLS